MAVLYPTYELHSVLNLRAFRIGQQDPYRCKHDITDETLWLSPEVTYTSHFILIIHDCSNRIPMRADFSICINHLRHTQREVVLLCHFSHRESRYAAVESWQTFGHLSTRVA